MINRRLSIAPMIDCTDRHFRYLMRLITKHTLLYTEMITTGAVLRGDHHRFLHYNACENPLAVQFGGSNPEDLAACATLAKDYGYDEINLNVGCPSDKVQSGNIGACLMADPVRVAQCVTAMKAKVSLPITVKTRIGIDQRDSYEELCDFIGTVAQAGCEVFIIHARKAWLSGLNPKQNRQIPPLKYEIVYQLQADFPHLQFIINGGLKEVSKVLKEHDTLDGVMIGREAYQNPYALVDVDSQVYGVKRSPPSRGAIIQAYLPYLETQLSQGVPASILIHHLNWFYHDRN